MLTCQKKVLTHKIRNLKLFAIFITTLHIKTLKDSNANYQTIKC